MRKIALFLFSISILAAQETSVQEFNSYMLEAAEVKDWWKVIDYSAIISGRFPSSPFAREASYVCGEAFYNLGQWEAANLAFTEYLNDNPKHFAEAITYKFQIAESFANGAKKRLFGSPKMPAWVPAKEDAIPIYDEVIAALPHSEMAAKSLLSKAHIQAVNLEEYSAAIETLEVLIRRFPKDALAGEAFLEKSRILLMQCLGRDLDPALLDLSSVNIRRFRLAFPREPLIAETEKIHSEMEELFAQNLLEVGKFYQKTKKIGASEIYYNRVIAKYPKSKAALDAQERLEKIHPTTT